MHPIGFNVFDDYDGDLCLCSRSERSNSVNIQDVFRIEGMLKVLNIFDMGDVFGTNKITRRFQNSLKSRNQR